MSAGGVHIERGRPVLNGRADQPFTVFTVAGLTGRFSLKNCLTALRDCQHFLYFSRIRRHQGNLNA
jgi:hypothetical protein